MFEKKRGTRFLASVMALVMLLSLAPVGALAAEGEGQPAENQAVTQTAVESKDQQAGVDTKDTNENTPTEPAKDSDSAEATKSEGDFDESFSKADADTSDNDNGIAVQNFDNDRAAKEQTITAEYWVTNAKVTAGGTESKDISATDPGVASENGAPVESLAPETGTQGNNNVIFWQARVLSGEDKQTNGSGVDSTSKGREIQSIRYYNSEFSYQEKGNAQWTEFTTTTTNGKVQEQLVFYYMIKADFEENVSVAITDWPNTSDSQIPQGAPSPHQVNYEVWKLADAGADLNNAEQLGETVPTYYNSALTISAIKVSMNDNQQYYIRNIVIDSTKGQYDNPAVTDSEAEFSLNLKTAGEDRNLSRNGVITIKIYVTAYKYELAYQTNEGRINDSSYSRAGYYLPKDPITAPTNVTKTGYTFAGWYTDNACTDNNKWTDSTMPRQKLTLYAKWNENNYTVNYNLNYTDATNSLKDKTGVKWGDNNLLPGDNPSREGFLFDAWYTQPTGGDKVDSNTAYSEVAANDTDPSVTLYAHWTEDPTARPTITDVYVYFKMVDAAGKNIPTNKINNEDLKKTVYNAEAGGATWATLGKIASAATLENGEKYTGTNATLKTVGNEATAQLKGDALHDSNKEIVNKVLANIEWFQLKQWDGATDYVPNGSSWHLDGKITGYTVTYNKGTTDSVDKMPVADEVVYYLSGSDYTVSDATPTRTGYVFTGWKSNIENNTTIYNAKGKFEMPAKNVVLTAQWEKDELVDPSVDKPEGITKGDGIADKYQIQVSFKAVNGTFEGCTSPDNQYTTVVTKYDNSTNMPSENGTAKLANKHLKAENPDAGFTGPGSWKKGTDACEKPKADDSVQNGDHFVVTFEQEKESVANPIHYTINQHFIDAQKADKIKSTPEQATEVKTFGDSIPEEMLAVKQDFGDPKQNYVYVPAETTYKVGDQKKETTDNLANGAVIDLYYYLDVIGGKDEKGNLIDKGDEIPDCYQVTIIYKSSDERRGKISDASLKKEVLTIKDEEGNRLSSGKVEITGASAEVTGSSCYFSSWTQRCKG